MRRGFALAGLLALLLAGLWWAVPAPVAKAQGERVDASAQLEAIRTLMQESVRALRAGDRDTAYSLARQAYLDHFELVEVPLRVMDPNFTLEMEYRFARWRSLIKDGAPTSEVLEQVQEIERGLGRVEAMMEGTGTLAPGLTVVASFSILFREGLEAILILSALLAFLRTRSPRLKRPVWLGALLALPASLLTWFLLVFVLRVAPLGRELLEAVVSIVAAGVMFYVSFWLLQRLELRHWMEFLRARAWSAVTTGSTASLLLLSFVAVYREGAETVLFYQVLLWIAEGMERWILLGAGLAGVALLAVGWAILYLGARLPLRAFLTGAVAVVMLLSVAVLGNAVRELQSAGVLGTSFLDWFPRINRFVAELLGLHPTLETLTAQAALLLIYLAGAFYVFWWQPRRAGITARKGESI